MTLATEIAALLEPARGWSGPQPISTVLNPAPTAGTEDRAMSPASQIFCLLTSLTDNEIDALAPVDRRLLQGQLERVHRMITGTTIISDALKADFLDELRDGQRRRT